MAAVQFDALRSLAFGSISGSYAALGSPLGFNWKMFKITNNTDGDMFISTDGTTDNLFVPATSFVLYDLSTNAPPVSVNDTFCMAIGTQFYVKQSTSPSTGAVYIEGIYSMGG
jgi:hypothetical protein